jgi:hypothetical protein
MIREGEKPIFIGKYPVKPLQRRTVPFIGPSVAPPFKKELLELRFLDELPEPVHHTSVEAGIIFILGTIDEVKVTPD